MMEMNKKIENVTEMYNEYIKNISTQQMAASLELCLYILKICEQNQYKKIIDCGSGITSYVVRYYQSFYDDVVVYSVDDHNLWLDKSKNFVDSYGLNTDNFVHRMENISVNDFDLVIHDYGRMGTRKEKIEYVIENLSTDGTTIIFDDCHKKNYYEHLKNVLDSKSLVYKELEETRDGLGRFSIETRK